MFKTSSLTDVETLRTRARQKIDEGSVTASYVADRATVLKLQDPTTRPMLGEILAVEQRHADEPADRLVALPEAAAAAETGLATSAD